MLKNWLINHIKSADTDYCDCVKKMMDAKVGLTKAEGSWLDGALKMFFGCPLLRCYTWAGLRISYAVTPPGTK